MNIPLRISSFCAIQWRTILNQIFADILESGDDGGSHLQSEEESGIIVRVADADVAHSVEDGVVVEDVVCRYKGAKRCCEVHHFEIVGEEKREEVGREKDSAVCIFLFPQIHMT